MAEGKRHRSKALTDGGASVPQVKGVGREKFISVSYQPQFLILVNAS